MSTRVGGSLVSSLTLTVCLSLDKCLDEVMWDVVLCRFKLMEAGKKPRADSQNDCSIFSCDVDKITGGGSGHGKVVVDEGDMCVLGVRETNSSPH